MIEVASLTRHYGSFTAVDAVSFTIGTSEVVGLLGHNGAGKTTIMKMLTGFLEPSSGRVVIDGLDINSERAAIQQRIGYLPENCPLYPEMTVIDYLAYQCALQGMDKAEHNTAIARAIDLTDLSAKATDIIATLSRGYRQRVGVAQAILHQPAIVILDEPTNGLDPTQILAMRSLIQRLAKEATVIVSTHILQEVQAVCDRVLILRGGKLAVDTDLASIQRSNTLHLVTGESDNTDVAALLRDVTDVVTVTEVEDSSIATHRHWQVNAEPSVAPEIARVLTNASIPLHALHQERHSLEKLFADINTVQPDAQPMGANQP